MIGKITTMGNSRARSILFGMLILILTGIIGCNSTLSRKKFTSRDLKGFPTQIYKEPPDSSEPEEFLRAIAGDTWKYFRDAVDQKSGLVVDKVWLKPDEVSDYTSITNIGLQMLSTISAMDFGFIDSITAEDNIRHVLTSLKRLPKYNGFLYNWYDLKSLKESRRYISTVDAGWLYSSLAIVAMTFPDLAQTCNIMIDQTDFNWLYDDTLHHFYLGYDIEQECYSPYHYGLLCSESRICLYWSIIQGKIQPEFWYSQERTLPVNYEQEQKPQGNWKEQSGTHYFNGYYQYKDLKIVPSWGGALFEFLMPGLLINERELAPLGIGENNRRAVEVHIDYALTEMGYPVWGMSPSTNPERGYGEYGVPLIGSRVGGYSPVIVSPHASILALPYAPEAVYSNLKTMLTKYDIYGEYGFYDSLDPKTDEIGRAYLALDQGMIMVTLNNHLNDNKMVRRFERLAGFEKIKNLLTEDEFYR
ncbi:MAG: DUF3131 domain-containing protein [Candidatus Marinimicrobia bacterium]|nr:DUF3131 domain-containing protein [Candidatus Neomarinimicrobiota bacterium]